MHSTVYNGVWLLHTNEGLDAATTIRPEKEHTGGAGAGRRGRDGAEGAPFSTSGVCVCGGGVSRKARAGAEKEGAPHEASLCLAHQHLPRG